MTRESQTLDMTVRLQPEIEEKLAQEARERGQSLDELWASIASEWLRKRDLERREDEEDIKHALEVLRTSNPAERLTSEQVMAELGITREEVDNAR